MQILNRKAAVHRTTFTTRNPDFGTEIFSRESLELHRRIGLFGTVMSTQWPAGGNILVRNTRLDCSRLTERTFRMSALRYRWLFGSPKSVGVAGVIPIYARVVVVAG